MKSIVCWSMGFLASGLFFPSFSVQHDTGVSLNFDSPFSSSAFQEAHNSCAQMWWQAHFFNQKDQAADYFKQFAHTMIDHFFDFDRHMVQMLNKKNVLCDDVTDLIDMLMGVKSSVGRVTNNLNEDHAGCLRVLLQRAHDKLNQVLTSAHGCARNF